MSQYSNQDYGRVIARRRQSLLDAIGARVWWMHHEPKARQR